MSALWTAIGEWGRGVARAWNDFWFTAADPATLSLLRILAGSMIFYTHLVWTIELDAFFGPDAWVSGELLQSSWEGQGGYFWSHLLWFESTAALWTVHIAALVVFGMFVLGLFSRTTAVLTFLLTVSYVHRAQNALFGLDQINVMLSMYLMLGPCGARYSLDRWLRRRRGAEATVPASVSANVAIRLIQIHLSVIYFFAGTRKLLGSAWWDGSAMWLSLANLEYRSIDMTWMADWPLALAFFTHLTIAFEVGYPALIWPRLTRPVMLLLAVWLHAGIAICMGMMTFGTVMLIANAAFLRTEWVRAVLDRGELRRLSLT